MEGTGDEKNGVCPQTEGGAGWLMGGAGAGEKWGLSPQPEAVPVGRWEALIKKWGRGAG
jgi:hypothetical protein